MMTNTTPSPMQQDSTISIQDVIDEMARLVQQGEFSEAEAIGHSAPFDLAIPKSHLPKGKVISEGAQAVVYESMMTTNTSNGAHDNNNTDDGITDTSNTTNTDTTNKQQQQLVAVKKVFIREPQDLIRFRREVSLLATLQHPHIATFLGARLLPPDYLMVLTRESSNLAHELHNNGWRPSWPGALHIGKQIATAIAHLHDNGIVHRDIKPANILLSSDRSTAKLTDLGIAANINELEVQHNAMLLMKNKPTGGFYKGVMVGTLEYMAPEVLLKQPHNTASDVFALAVMINEIAAGIVPYSDCTRDNPLAHTILEMGYGRQELAVAVAAEGLRPTLGPSTHSSSNGIDDSSSIGVQSALRKLLNECWSAVPEQRPSAHRVAEVLHSLSELMPFEHHSSSNGNGRAGGDSDVVITSSNINTTSTTMNTTTTINTQSVLDNPPEWLTSLLSNTTTTTNTITNTIRAGSFASAGARGEDRMEDRCLIARNACCVPGCLITGVFDGHGGFQAAEYLSSYLEQHIEQRWILMNNSDGSGGGGMSNTNIHNTNIHNTNIHNTNTNTNIHNTNTNIYDTNTNNHNTNTNTHNNTTNIYDTNSIDGPGLLLRDALLDVDAAFCAKEDSLWNDRIARGLESSTSNRKYPGSTAVVAMILGNTLTIANIGDSRAVLCSEGRAVHVTRDHTLAIEEERKRIISCGARILPPIVPAQQQGIINNINNSDNNSDDTTINDTTITNNTNINWQYCRIHPSGLSVTRSIGDANVKPYGVIAEPDIHHITLDYTKHSFLIIASDGIWDVVSPDDAVDIVHDTVKQPAMCAQRIVLEALTRGSKDNVTVVVVIFDEYYNGGSGGSGGACIAEKVYYDGRVNNRSGGGGMAATKRVAARLVEDEMMDTY